MTNSLHDQIRWQLSFFRDCVHQGYIPLAALRKAENWEKHLNKLIKELEELLAVERRLKDAN